MYNHKFNFHINGGRSDAFEAAFRLQPKIVKTLDFSVEPMRQLRERIPDLFLIGRLFVTPQDFGQLGGGLDPNRARRRGIEMAEKILALEVNQSRHHFNGQPLFHAWESLNEVLPEHATADYHKLYDEYQVAFLETMRANGFEAIAQNFGTGNGTAEQWLTLYPGTLESYTYLGFHEYDWPTMNRLHQQGLNEGNGGMWLCLRYRRIMEGGIRQKYGDQHRCIITECGMTQGVWGNGAADIGPWAAENTVPGNSTPTPISVDDYWNTLLWYNHELMQDDYLMGACLFVTGASGGWDSFEHLGPIMERLAAYQQVINPDPDPPPLNGAHMIGLNIDIGNPRGNPASSELSQTLRAQSVRFTYRDGSSGSSPSENQLQLYGDKISSHAQSGVSSLVILTNESLPGNPSSSASDSEWDSYIARFAGRAKQVAQRFVAARPAFQIWNEPDFTAPTSGYDPTLRPAVFARMVRACYQAIKGVDGGLLVVIGGLASGNPAWLKQVISAGGGSLQADAVAIHPYGQRPEPSWPSASWGFGYVGDLLGAYQQVSSLPMWITEIGVETGGAVATAEASRHPRHTLLTAADSTAEVGIANNELQAEYLTRFYQAMMTHFADGVQRVYWFCYADGMVPPFGLLDINSNPKPAYNAFANLPRPTEPSPIYAAHYLSHDLMPQQPFGQLRPFSLTVRNGGNWTWPSGGTKPVKLGYRWLTRDGRAVPSSLWTAIRSSLPQNVSPGQSVTIAAEVVMPQALGPLTLQLDMVEEGVAWFSEQGVSPLAIPVDIRASAEVGTVTVRASHNNLTSGYDNLLNALDGQANTRWSSVANQSPDMWFQLDMGAIKTITQLTLDNAASPDDYPRGYRVRLSLDGETWRTVASQPSNSAPLSLSLPPSQTRYIQVEQTATSDRYWWSIHEVKVTTVATPTVQASHNNLSTGRDNLTYMLDGNPYTRWSSRAVQRPGMWVQWDMGEQKTVRQLKLLSRTSPQEYPRGYLIRLSLDGLTWTEVARNPTNSAEVAVSFPTQTARFIHIEQTGTANRWWWAIHGVEVS